MRGLKEVRTFKPIPCNPGTNGSSCVCPDSTKNDLAGCLKYEESIDGCRPINCWKWDEIKLPKSSLEGIHKEKEILSWDNIILTLLDSPSISSKEWIYKQYDYQVQSNTVIPPGKADAAVIRLRPQDQSKKSKLNNRGIAAVVD